MARILKEDVIFDNGFFEFVESENEYTIENNKKQVKRKYVRRPPGIRAIIMNDKNQILLSYEYRYELESFDYRLPGGKVFDSLEDYKKSLQEDNMFERVIRTVVKEVKEEVGIVIQNPEFYCKSSAGAKVEWDLYYFIIHDYEIVKDGQELEEDELVEGFVWKTFEEIIEMCIHKEIQEDRTIGVLLPYILKTKNNK